MASIKKEAVLGLTEDLIQIGNHVAVISNSDEEIYDITARFFERGLKEKEKVMFFPDTISPEEFEVEMKNRGVVLTHQDSIQITPAEEVYCPEGKFEMDNMMTVLKNSMEESLQEGFSSIRGGAEMTWALKKLDNSQQLFKYEAKLTNTLRNMPFLGVCMYNTTKFNGETIMDVLKTHPLIVTGGKMIKNPYYIPADEFLKDYISHAL